MTEAFWWYVLAGFLLGFSVSTLWEWIYFRRRRMVIRDRRIAELEATVRAYTAATIAPGDEIAADDWAEPAFQNPGVYLETEEASPATPRPDTLPPAQSPLPASTAVAAAPIINGAHAPATQPASILSNSYATYSSPTPAGFQSVAVQQPSSSISMATHAVAPPATEDTRLGSVLAVLGAAAVAQHVADASAPTESEDEDSALPPPGDHAVAPASVYANGATSGFVQEAVSSSVPEHDNRAITSAEIGVLVSSINELIDTVSQEQKAEIVASVPSQAEIPVTEAYTDPYVTRIDGRTEYVLVRMVQSLVRFMRELRGILTGAQNMRPAIHTSATPTGDDLARIAGLSDEQAARLRTAGVTTYARLAELSPDELRMITLTPGVTNADPAWWQAQALQLTAAMQQDGTHS